MEKGTAYTVRAHLKTKTTTPSAIEDSSSSVAVTTWDVPGAPTAPPDSLSTIWSATLTVDADGSSTTLSNNRFNFDGKGYRVTDLSLDGSGNLSMRLSTSGNPSLSLRSGSLRIGGNSYALSSGFSGRYFWSNGPSWSAGEVVTVELVVPASGPAITAGEGKLTIAWAAPGDTGGRGARITGYDVAYKTTSETNWTNHTHSGTTTRAEITNLTNGTTYDVRVRAQNGIDPGSAWASGQGTPESPLSTDASLSALTATTDTSADGTFATALTLAPAFDASKLTYTASVANATTHLKVTPTVAATDKAMIAAGKRGTDPLPSVTDKMASDAIALTEGGNFIDVVVTAEDTTITKTYTLAITRARVLEIALTNDSRAYGGTDDLSYSLSNLFTGDTKNDVISGALTRAPGDDAGEYAVDPSGLTIAPAYASEYELPTATTPAVYTITPKLVTLSGAAVLTKTYDGDNTTAAAELSGVTVTSGVSGESLTLTLTAGAYADENAGMNKTIENPEFALVPVEASGTTASNYSLPSSIPLSGTIMPQPTTFTGTAAAREYDGTDTVNTAISGTFEPALLGTDVVTITGGTYASADAGAAKPITGASKGGADAGNYAVTIGTITGEITKKPTTFTATVPARAYNGSDQVGSGTAISGSFNPDLLNGDVVTITGGTYASADVGVGHAITDSTIGGADGGNYAVTLSVTGTINQASITAIGGVTVDAKTANGNTDATFDTSAATGTGVVSGELADFRAGGLQVSGSFAAATAGTHNVDVTYTLADNGSFKAANYEIAEDAKTAILSGVINPSDNNKSTDATLSLLRVTLNDPPDNTVVSLGGTQGSTRFTARVDAGVAEVKVWATPKESGASVSIDGETPDGTVTVSKVIDLVYGDNVVAIVVTAPDGTTTANYSVTIERAYPVPTVSSVTAGASSGAPNITVATTNPDADTYDVVIQIKKASAEWPASREIDHQLPENMATTSSASPFVFTGTGLEKGTAYTVRAHLKTKAATPAAIDDSSSSVAVTTWDVPGAPTAPPDSVTTIWSATLTVDADGSSTTLSNNRFNFDGKGYRVTDLSVDGSGNLSMRLSTSGNPSASLRSGSLRIGGNSYALSSGFSGRYFWSNGPSWSAGNMVAVELVVPASGIAVTAGNDNLSIAWAAPADTGGRGASITGYDVQYKETSAPNWTDVTHSGTATSVEITGLAGGTSYTVRVRAKNGISPGSAWASGQGTPQVPPPELAAPTFSPANGEVVTDNTTDITLTFDEAIKKDGSGTDFADADLSSILTLKTTDASGTAIPYAATINGAKTIVTINPDSSLSDGAVYVAISNDYYDADGNQGSAANATFTVDATAPAPTFSPANGAKINTAGTNITVTFIEAIKSNGSGTDFTDDTIDGIFMLKSGGSSGSAIAFNATIDAAKKVITIDPTPATLSEGDVYVSISDAYYDAAGNQGSMANATFTIDVTAPTVTFNPADGDTVTDAATDITITFSEAVTKSDGTALSDSDLSTFAILKETDESGTAIGFTASINPDKTVITIDPTLELSDGDVYVAILNNYADAAGNRGNAENATFEIDTSKATVTFDPANGDTIKDAATDITLTFSEAVTKQNGDPLGNTDFSSILALKKTSSGGNDISFSASINDANTIITIDPSSNLEEGNVYVAISGGYYNAAGNEGDAANAIFTVDLTAPTPTFAPANGDTVTDAATNITITFSEAVTKADGTALANADLSTFVALKETDESGTPIGFSATINTDKTVITINPSADLADGKVYVAIPNNYADAAGNRGNAENATFTVDTSKATVTFDPANGDTTKDAATDITLTFSEAVTKSGGVALANADLSGLLTLKKTDSGGDDIGYSATINTEKTVITIDPTSNLEEGNVYVAISGGYYNAAGNEGDAANATFTVDLTAPTPTFAPANGDTVTDTATNITITFSEAVTKANGTALANGDLSTFVTLKETGESGTPIGFSASINTDKTVITIDPTSELSDGDVYVAISNNYADAAGNRGDAENATFEVDTSKATVTFDPANGDTTKDAATDITLTFSEAVTKSGGVAFANADLSGLLTLKKTDSGGDDIGYSATINSGKTVITIDPTSNLEEGNVYVAISGGYYNAAGNEGDAAAATFTVDLTAPSPTFDPANSAVVTDAGRNLTITFGEAIKKSDGSDFSDSELKGILTLKEDDTNGTAIDYAVRINPAKTAITLNPVSNLSDGAVYVAISDGYYDVAGNQGSAANATITVDATAPSPTFDPANSAKISNAGTNITITFTEAIKSDGSGTDFTNTTIDNIVRLKVTNSGGSNITFNATIDSAKKVITIDPSSNLSEGDVYVAVTDGYYDAAGNQGSAANATFTVDLTAPTATFAPANGDTVTDNSRNITVTFSEAVTKANGASLVDGDLSTFVTLKETDDSGTAIGFSASINGAKKVITINPNSNLSDGAVYVAISTGYYDAAGNQGSAATATFTVDTTVAAPTFSPASGTTVNNNGTNITITFAEAIKSNGSGTDFTDSTIDNIVRLKVTNSSGSNITFNATIDSAKKVITIDPSSALSDGAVYVAITNAYYDAAGNQGSAASATFTVDTGVAAPTFSPVNGATVNNNGTNITITFAEAIKKDNSGTDFANTDIDNIVRLKVTNNSGSNITFDATIDSAKKVITIDPSSALSDGAVYVAVTNAYYDAAGNQGSAANATFTVDTTGVSAPTFSPANGDTVTDNTTNITLTFAEAIKKSGGGDFANSDLSGILTLKVDDDSGAAIPYTATIDSAKKVIIINPTSNLSDGAVYVAISTGYYDAAGNQGSTANATFTVDTTVAAPTFSPASGATVANNGTNITVTFAEAIKSNSSGTDFTNTSIDNIVRLKMTNSGGSNITFNATIDSAKKVITIDPSSALSDGAVYVAVTNAYYDAAGNQGSAANATITVDTGVAAPTFSPANGTTVANNGTNITITFAEAIKSNSGGTDFTDSTIDGIVRLKVTNSSGANITFNATIDAAKKVITIDPSSALSDGAVYVAITNAYYDAAGNQGNAASATITVDTTGVSAPTFSPANGATVTDNTTNITLTFAEAIAKSGGGDFASSDLSNILTLKRTDAGGANIPYAATINGANTIITINPTSNLPEGNVYVAISTGYYDAVGNQGTAATATITVDTTGVAAPTFSPANGDTVADNTTNITLTFAEAIKKSGGGDFANSDLSGILTLKRTNAGGADIQYAATINGAKTIITINPSSNLPDGVVYVAISTGYYDAVGNQGSTASATITVDTTGVAAPTFSPANGTTVKNNTTNITLTFAEVIKKSGGGDFANSDLSGILTLKKTNASGADIPYSATINGAKTVITINPTSNLDDGNVYVAITNGYYDAVGNQGVTATATFTVDTTLSTDATLSALTASGSATASGTFSTITIAPVFVSGTTAYTANVSSEIAWAKVQPTVSDTGKATVRVGKANSLQTVTSGSFSQAINLVVGSNAILIEVTAEDASKQTYTVTITRDEPLPSAVSLSVPNRVNEDVGSVTLTATLVGGTLNEMLECTLVKTGTASSTTENAAEWDYRLVPPLQFQARAASGTMQIEIHDDSLREPPETVTVTIDDTSCSAGETAMTGFSATATFTIIDNDSPPDAPNLQLTPSDGALTASWDEPSGNGSPITGYGLRYREEDAPNVDATTSNDPATGWVTSTYSATTMRQTLNGLTNGTLYRVEVQARNAAGVSLWSESSMTGTPGTGGLAQVHEAMLSEVVRAVSGRTTGAISKRVEEAMNGGGGGGGTVTASLGGQATVAGALVAHAPGMMNGHHDMRDMLGGSHFNLPLYMDDGVSASDSVGSASATIWGSGAHGNLSGENDGLDWNGGLHGAQVGVDAKVRDNLLAGLALSWDQGEFNYDTGSGEASGRGDYNLDMLSVHPYIGWRAGYMDLWATAGYGTGEIEVAPDQGTAVSNDATLWTVGAGGGGLVWTDGEVNVRLKGEAMQTNMDLDGNEDMAAMTVDTSLIRLAAEASYTVELAGGGRVSPNLSLGARHDGGDGNTGTGAELSGGMRYENAQTGVVVSTSIYGMFGRSDYEEWGVSGLVQKTPDTNGRGLSITLRPGYGSSGQDTGRIWTQGMRENETTAAPVVDSSGRLDARLGYGLWAPWSSGLVTPWGGLTMDEHSKQYRAGLDWAFNSSLRMNLSGEQHETADTGTGDRRYRMGLEWAVGGNGVLDMNLSGERFESVNAPASHSLMLKGTVRF